MSFAILITLLITLLASSAQTGAKPLNQNQVKFRRLPPKEFSAVLGSSITIECDASASPPPSIHWLKDGEPIQQNEFDQNQLEDGQLIRPKAVDEVNRISLSTTRSRLFIDCADIQDEAIYTCVADNAFSRISAHTKLNLIRPISATGSGSDDNILSLDEVSGAVELLADGSKAKPEDTVERPGSRSLAAVPQCLSQRKSREITDPVRIHMWTHNIVEIMSNDIILFCRSNAKKQNVNIQQKSQQQHNDDQFIATSSDLSIKQQTAEVAPQQQQQDDNNNNDSSSNMRASITWTLPDDRLVSAEQNGKYEILETGDLLIKDLRWSDMGSYVCTVSNDQSSDSISTFVYPASVKVNSKRATALNMRLTRFT